MIEEENGQVQMREREHEKKYMQESSYTYNEKTPSLVYVKRGKGEAYTACRVGEEWKINIHKGKKKSEAGVSVSPVSRI